MKPLEVGKKIAEKRGATMARRPRRNHSPAFRAKAAGAAIKGEKTLVKALVRRGKPRIFNTDQGSQFTATDFTKVLKKAEIAISMDGKGAWRDTVFVGWLWRTVKYEEVYLRAQVGVAEISASISRYLAFHNGGRPHSSPGGKTPDQAYINLATPIPVAA